MKAIINGELVELDAENSGAFEATQKLIAERLRREEAIAKQEEQRREMMLKGVEFDGVFCSVTKEDQAGLLAVLTAFQIQGPQFKPTTFYFKNGNKLRLSLDNIQQFIAVWMPYRQSFFVENPDEVVND